VLGLIRSGTAPEQILVVCPSLDRVRAPLETAFGALGVPYALDGPRLPQTPVGRALLSPCASPGSGRPPRPVRVHPLALPGLPRARGLPRGAAPGRGVRSPERVEEEVVKLRGQPLAFLDRLRAGLTTTAAVRELAGSMLRAAHGLDALRRRNPLGSTCAPTRPP
jgi:hypothetical protein